MNTAPPETPTTDASAARADDTAARAYDDAARLLGALAHPLRLHLVARLLAGPCCVSDLVEGADCPQPKVSQHLAVLRDAGLVECAVDGRRRCYHLLRPDLVASLLALLPAHPPLDLAPGASS